DGVQDLGARPGLERLRLLLDQTEAEVHVPEQAALVGLSERRAAPELHRPPDVVDERRGEEQVAPQTLMQLRRLAAERRDADGVLEQPAGVGVMSVESRG